MDIWSMRAEEDGMDVPGQVDVQHTTAGKVQAKARLYEAFAASGKALANGKRLELLDLLAQSERTVEALAVAAGLNLTTASAHLQTLKQAGLVATRRDGVRIHYRLAG